MVFLQKQLVIFKNTFLIWEWLFLRKNVETFVKTKCLRHWMLTAKTLKYWYGKTQWQLFTFISAQFQRILFTGTNEAISGAWLSPWPLKNSVNALCISELSLGQQPRPLDEELKFWIWSAKAGNIFQTETKQHLIECYLLRSKCSVDNPTFS